MTIPTDTNSKYRTEDTSESLPKGSYKIKASIGTEFAHIGCRKGEMKLYEGHECGCIVYELINYKICSRIHV